MMEKFHQLYEKLTNEIEACASSQDQPRKWIECCFVVCANAWLDLKKIFAGHSFQNREQEIEFFKFIKPKFAGLIEFFVLIYRSEIFIPEDRKESLSYWEDEMQKSHRFIRENKNFYQYWKKGRKEKDHRYFLRHKHSRYPETSIKVFDDPPDMVTSHDRLIASFIARDRYITYVQEKIRSKK